MFLYMHFLFLLMTFSSDLLMNSRKRFSILKFKLRIYIVASAIINASPDEFFEKKMVFLFIWTEKVYKFVSEKH